jgi:hypothetical protein
MARRNIFSRRKHRLLRKQVPRAEAISSVLLAAGLVATTVWVFAQRDAYDPSVRDLPPRTPQPRRPENPALQPTDQTVA